MKRIKFITEALLIAVLFIIGACSTTQFSSVWKDEAYERGPLKKNAHYLRNRAGTS